MRVPRVQIALERCRARDADDASAEIKSQLNECLIDLLLTY